MWEMYLKRRWDFFPVGDSFRGQEERRKWAGSVGVASGSKTGGPTPPTHLSHHSMQPSAITASSLYGTP